MMALVLAAATPATRGVEVKTVGTIALCACAALAAPASAAPPPAAQRLDIERQIKEQLKDPESARFKHGDWKIAKTNGLYCGYYNAKNSFGGYGGFDVFEAFTDNSGKVITVVVGEGVLQSAILRACADAGAL